MNIANIHLSSKNILKHFAVSFDQKIFLAILREFHSTEHHIFTVFIENRLSLVSSSTDSSQVFPFLSISTSHYSTIVCIQSPLHNTMIMTISNIDHLVLIISTDLTRTIELTSSITLTISCQLIF